MGFLQLIKNFFGKRELQDAQRLAHDAQRALQEPTLTSTSLAEELPSKTEIEHDSYQLGLAAGYTGKTIKEIEASLNRIETQSATKDWVTSRLLELNATILDYLRKHEENEQKRFELIQQTFNLPGKPIPRLQTVGTSTLPINLPISPKMERVLAAVREAKEISYDNLASKLSISLPEIRGLLANIAARANVVERFRIARKGWVRFKEEKESA